MIFVLVTRKNRVRICKSWCIIIHTTPRNCPLLLTYCAYCLNISNQDSNRTENDQVENSLDGNVPKVGMKFCTEQEAYDFYARVNGFSIRKSSFHTLKNSNTIKNRTFLCSCAHIKLIYHNLVSSLHC